MSLPEVLLWHELRKRPGGFKFRRQHPAGPYVLDFFCAEGRLAIEISEHDVTVLRIPAAEVLRDLHAAVAYVIEHIRSGLPLHQPAAGPPPRSWED